MAKVFSASNYIIKVYGLELSITPLKLQKLLYYSQAYHLVLCDNKLFDEAIQAWDYGPVVPEIYYEYKSSPTEILTLGEKDTDIDLEQNSIEIVDKVINAYGNFSPTRLIELTHKEAPWKEAYAKGQNYEIDTDRMKEFYRPYVKAD